MARAQQAVRHVKENREHPEEVISYRGLQVLLGLVALALVPVLVLGKWYFDGPGLLSSISAYYYTSMGDYFVGSLCAIGIFMTSYRGRRPTHHLAGIAGALLAIGVALFPTAPPEGVAITKPEWFAEVHFFCAVGLFVMLALFSLKFFPAAAAWRVDRSLIHRICGLVIAASIAWGLYIWLAARGAQDPSIFWAELFAVIAFGVSWLAHGGFWDKRSAGRADRPSSEAAVRVPPAKAA